MTKKTTTKSLPKAKIVEVIQAGGCLREGVTTKLLPQENFTLVPVWQLWDKDKQYIGRVSQTMLDNLFVAKIIRRCMEKGRLGEFVKAEGYTDV